ncbi:flagellar basal body P-ring biosynthesis protein FlgA [Roseibium alexandrii]|uniref:Flagellar basal body P-ring biosynthesis protein FlgA n=2 Tax=Roseibium alexandrii TaxID=388408 RepID=A0A0M7A007_9HYPH|nr:flagellar basal body P-ring biosynthesis protein FlgA [Roseibium alexandrii]
MKTLMIAALSLALAALTSFSAAANEHPVLRSQVMTLSDIVTVGDFYSNAGDVAQVPLFRSPDMGTSGNVPATTVAQRARDAGLVTAGTDGLRTVVVHRGATRLNRHQLENLIRNDLAKLEAGIDPEGLEITLLQAPDQILADPKATDPVRIDRINWSRNNGHFTVFATIAVEHGTRPLTVTGTAVEMIDVLVLGQPLKRGDIVQDGDLTTIRLPRLKVNTAALEDGTNIVGKAARVNLRPSQPLSHKDFEYPVLVERGDKVTVTYNVGAMNLTSRAKALTNGAKGDVIDVMNLQSRRVVPATVTSRGQVAVHAAHAIVASLNKEAN